MLASNGRFVSPHPRLVDRLGDGGGKAAFVLAWPHETSTGDVIYVHSDDVRAIQLAKAALYAGSKLLMNRLNLADVDRVALAGGFGSYIDPKHAMLLGMIPDCDLAKVKAVGNAAGDGARMMLLDRKKRAEAQWAARWTTYIETAVEPSFQEEFVGALNLPHAVDAFPHLDPIIAAARAQWPPDRAAAVAAMVSGGRRTDDDQRAARRERRRRRDA
ncbi:MAG: ASKHA domain-containing protein [Caldilineaceae bacterium]